MDTTGTGQIMGVFTKILPEDTQAILFWSGKFRFKMYKSRPRFCLNKSVEFKVTFTKFSTCWVEKNLVLSGPELSTASLFQGEILKYLRVLGSNFQQSKNEIKKYIRNNKTLIDENTEQLASDQEI